MEDLPFRPERCRRLHTRVVAQLTMVNLRAVLHCVKVVCRLSASIVQVAPQILNERLQQTLIPAVDSTAVPM